VNVRHLEIVKDNFIALKPGAQRKIDEINDLYAFLRKTAMLKRILKVKVE